MTAALSNLHKNKTTTLQCMRKLGKGRGLRDGTAGEPISPRHGHCKPNHPLD